MMQITLVYECRIQRFKGQKNQRNYKIFTFFGIKILKWGSQFKISRKRPYTAPSGKMMHYRAEN